MKNLIEFANHIKDVFISTDFLEYPEKADLINKNWYLTETRMLLEHGKYLEKEICDAIYKKYTFRHHKKIIYKGIVLSFDFYDEKENERYAKYFLGYVCFLINLLDTYKPLKKQLKLILINYDGKKRLPDNNIFNSCNVNSGLTYCYSDDYAEVTVYRQEEMAKVLTHEMIHFYGIDLKYIYNEEKINNFFCMVDGKNVNVNEAFTETLACLINIVLYTILEKKQENIFNQTLINNLKKEQTHSRGQAYKILKTVNFNKNCTELNKEDTHAIAYYVIKSILLNNTEDFLDYLKRNNFRLKDKADFIEFIYSKLIGIDYTLFGKVEYEQQKDKHSMRMTIIDTMELMNKRKLYKDKSNP